MTATRPRYEPLDHTSEAGIVARGSTLADAFAAVAEGMYSLMLDLDGIEERESREIALEGENAEALLVDWLAELVYLTDAETMVFRRFEVSEMSETRLRARVWGERYDAARHPSHVAVKAVTRHLLEIAREDGGYRLRVLFDI